MFCGPKMNDSIQQDINDFFHIFFYFIGLKTLKTPISFIGTKIAFSGDTCMTSTFITAGH